VLGRRAITAIVTVLVLCVGAAVVYFSSYIKATSIQSLIAEHYKSLDSPSTGTTLGYNILSFLPSVIVVIMNVVLTATIWYCERLSLYPTITDMQAAVARNLTLAMVINTALVAIPIHLNDWYGPHGLLVEVYSIMISNALLSPMLYLISPAGLVRWIQRRQAVGEGSKCMLTQQEANSLMEDLPINMPNLSAGLMKTFLLSLMYAPVLPFGLVIGFVGTLLQYWVNKYMLLRRHCRPVRLSDELDEVMLQFVPLSCGAYAVSTCYFYYDLSSALYLPGAIGCCIVLVYLLSPLRTIVKRLLRKSTPSLASLSETTKSYEDSAIDFFTDYDRANPVTTEEGNKWWVQLVSKHKGADFAPAARCLTQPGNLHRFAKDRVPRPKLHQSTKIRSEGENIAKSADRLVQEADFAGKPQVNPYHLALLKSCQKSSKGALSSLLKSSLPTS